LELAGVSLVCCTRERPGELARLIRSLVLSRERIPGVDVELLIVDDGALSDDLIASLTEQTRAANIVWAYHNKQEQPGLLRSRIATVALARHDWILFLDDDVEVEPDYLARFVDVIGQNPELAGLGGVDLLTPPLSCWRLLGRLAAGLEPLRAGRLSASGFPAHIDRARTASKPFASLRIYGCNMGFRKTALQSLHPLAGFDGYSLYEDAYLSFEASRSGLLLIDPALKVRHHHSPSARDSSREVGRMSVLNHRQLMRLYGASRWRHASMLVSILLLAGWSSATGLSRGGAAKGRDMAFARGQLSALGILLGDLFRGSSP
jgi:GT2 family glycosyltransferase